MYQNTRAVLQLSTAGLSRWAGNGRGTYTESLQEAWNILHPKFPLEGLAVSGHKHKWNTGSGWGRSRQMQHGESCDIQLPKQQEPEAVMALRACSKEGRTLERKTWLGKGTARKYERPGRTR